MEALHEALEDQMKGSQLDNLDDVSKKWADYCLSNFTGETLKKGLMISAALSDFNLELK